MPLNYSDAEAISLIIRLASQCAWIEPIDRRIDMVGLVDQKLRGFVVCCRIGQSTGSDAGRKVYLNNNRTYWRRDKWRNRFNPTYCGFRTFSEALAEAEAAFAYKNRDVQR
jgi:hypothetical protein